MSEPQKTMTSALEELGAELGIAEADFGGKVKIEGKYPLDILREWAKTRARKERRGMEWAATGIGQVRRSAAVEGSRVGAKQGRAVTRSWETR